VAQSLGVKVVVNEFVSYLQLAASGGAGLAERSRVILTYALCGFTNFASVGIMVTGMSALCPGRRAEITALGLKSLVAASIAWKPPMTHAGLLSSVKATACSSESSYRPSAYVTYPLAACESWAWGAGWKRLR